MGRLTLKVTPGARKPDIQFEPTPSGGAPPQGRNDVPLLRVRLTQPPQDGRANRALQMWLSELSGVPVRVIAGAKGRIKIIEFDTDEASFLEALRLALERENPRKK